MTIIIVLLTNSLIVTVIAIMGTVVIAAILAEIEV